MPPPLTALPPDVRWWLRPTATGLISIWGYAPSFWGGAPKN